MNPVAVVLVIAGVVSAFTWITSLVTHEHSWVDRLWSIVPVIYTWVFAASTGLMDARLTLMAVLVTAWGARLTFNFARKGGYTGTEDYRWAVLRARMKRWQFEVFNLFFIVLYQNAILVLITMPALTAWENRTPIGPLDVVVALLFVALLAGETIADQQQWNFHEWKKRTDEARPRFLQSGLFAVSRHPNFFFEQAQWWTVFLLGAVAAGSLIEWTALGAVLLTLLFVGSTFFTESITRSKYPEYAEYQARVSAIVPWFPRRAAAELAAR